MCIVSTFLDLNVYCKFNKFISLWKFVETLNSLVLWEGNCELKLVTFSAYRLLDMN